MINLENEIAIVTGARRGMGKAHALTLAKLGAKVVVTDISQEECQFVVDEIEKNNGQAMAIECDVSKKQDIDEMIKKTVEKWGKIDVLVNNAGIAQFKPFLEITEQEWDKTIDINLKGYFLCAQAVAQEMVKQKSGSIINIASIAMGQVGVGFQNLAHYSASKGGIVAMTETMAIELGAHNIRVNAIAPGVIETPMVDPVKQDKQAMQGILARLPLKRIGRSEEVANLVAFLASDASSYMTGSTVVIDGGWLAV